MKCALCLYIPPYADRIADAAVTVIDGTAVCYDHMGFVRGGGFNTALRLWSESAKKPPPERPQTEGYGKGMKR